MLPLVVSEVVLKQRWNWEKVSILINFRQVVFDADTVGSPAVLYQWLSCLNLQPRNWIFFCVQFISTHKTLECKYIFVVVQLVHWVCHILQVRKQASLSIYDYIAVLISLLCLSYIMVILSHFQVMVIVLSRFFSVVLFCFVNGVDDFLLWKTSH